jgi:hypothetical protein
VRESSRRRWTPSVRRPRLPVRDDRSVLPRSAMLLLVRKRRPRSRCLGIVRVDVGMQCHYGFSKWLCKVANLDLLPIKHGDVQAACDVAKASDDLWLQLQLNHESHAILSGSRSVMSPASEIMRTRFCTVPERSHANVTISSQACSIQVNLMRCVCSIPEVGLPRTSHSCDQGQQCPEWRSMISH